MWGTIMADIRADEVTISSGISSRDSEDGASPSNYRMSTQAIKSVDELLAKDAEDESLQRYKEQLLGAAAHGDRGDTSDTRRVVVEEFKVEFEDGREDIVYHLDTLAGVEHMRTTPFTMEEGSRYRFAIAFRVNQAIVSGLRFRNKVKKTVLSTHDEVVLGSYAPRSENYVFVFPRHEWMEAPSGLFYRGKYMGRFLFIDDDHTEHLKLFYTFGT
ncbi:putative rho GDP-dissociation inhibitor 1 [Phytophthora citrophthora]|uniref:Rho GDP-dissociation inhibitor 1 n=1 Tax=Phytophthora citrophthora TaxID=4793 RepID=A0AAD9LQU4_9STRA|nr:putative rho GDP-dissociation inhibitor 1 [Phytophthora citrophthora]